MERCTAVTRAGEPCRGQALPSGWCFSHDPELKAQRAAGASAGGTHSAKVYRLVRGLPAELSDVPARLRDLMERVERGEVTARTCEAFATLCGRLLDVLRFADELGRARDVEDRIAALEANQPDRGASVRRYA